MRGHEQLIALRRKRVRPQIVFIDVGGTDALRTWADWHICTPDKAHVAILDSDAIAGLDLRFVVGMNVSVSGEDEGRVTAVYEACMAAGARRVLACVPATQTLLDSLSEQIAEAA